MLVFCLVSGAILALSGVLVYFNPLLISGLNTMSKKRLARVDVDGLKKATCWLFVTNGAVMFVLGVLSCFFRLGLMPAFAFVVLIFAIVLIAMFLNRKFDSGITEDERKNEKAQLRFSVAFAVAIMAVVAVVYSYCSKPSKIELIDDEIVISGQYGTTIPVGSIVRTTTLKYLPDIALRTNGISTGKTNKGYFRLKSGEECMLFVTDNGGPFIEIRTTDGLYYLNCATSEETLQLAVEIRRQY